MKEAQIRIDGLETIMHQLKRVSSFYVPSSPAWVLIQAAWGHINSLHHLEAKTNFDENTLGVKDTEGSEL